MGAEQFDIQSIIFIRLSLQTFELCFPRFLNEMENSNTNGTIAHEC